MKPWPLQLRLSILVSIVLLVVITTVSVVAYLDMEESLISNTDQTLRVMCKAIQTTLTIKTNPQVHQQEFRSIIEYSKSRHSARYRIWLDDTGETLYSSDPPGDKHRGLFLHLPVRQQPEVGQFTLFNITYNKYPYRIIWLRQRQDKRIINIALAHSNHYTYHELGEYLQLLLILGGSMLLGTLLLVPVIISWGMRPIEIAASRLRQITHKNLGRESLKDLQVPRELKPFVEAVNNLLKRLDNALKQQKQFTANASHELRTPLALLKCNLQSTKIKDRSVQEYKSAMDEMLKDIQRMERMISQLLSLARLDESEAAPSQEEIPLHDLLADLAEIFEVRAAARGVRVVCRNCQPVWVRGNENELRDLFINLLENAVNYGPANETVEINWQKNGNDFVNVHIHDAGGNIPPDKQEQLFIRFYRVDSSRSRATGGAGLGLAIAREITQRHQGKISISSQPETGTDVTVSLPFLK